MRENMIAPPLSRRHFILTAASAAGGAVMIGIVAVPQTVQARRDRLKPALGRYRLCAARNLCLDRHRSRQLVFDPLPAIGDGTGQLDGAADDDRRRTAVRLVEGSDRICFSATSAASKEHRVYGDMFSHGSMSVRQSQKLMQQVGASARERLIAAQAAARWKVAASESVWQRRAWSRIGQSGRTLHYGDLCR